MPIMTVPSAIRKMVSSSAALRPLVSPMRPITMPPIGRAFQRPHDVQFSPAAIVGELVDLDSVDAMLGRDRAAIAGHQVVDRAADGVAVLHELRLAPAHGRLAVEVKVAVADMAEH